MGVSQTGPTLSWSASERERGVELLRRVGREADQEPLAHLLAHLAGRRVVLADVHAVRPRREREVGPVVQPEERVVLAAGRAEARRRLEQRVVVQLLVAKLDHVDPATERRREHVLRGGVHDEVEPGSPQALARFGEPHVSRRGSAAPAAA